MLEEGARLVERDFAKEPLTEKELKALIPREELDRFLNPRSIPYQKLGLERVRPTYTQALGLVVKSPNLLRRPIAVLGREKVWGFNLEGLRRLVALSRRRP